jgi:hypothetical protein
MKKSLVLVAFALVSLGVANASRFNCMLNQAVRGSNYDSLTSAALDRPVFSWLAASTSPVYIFKD